MYPNLVTQAFDHQGGIASTSLFTEQVTAGEYAQANHMHSLVTRRMTQWFTVRVLVKVEGGSRHTGPSPKIIDVCEIDHKAFSGSHYAFSNDENEQDTTNNSKSRDVFNLTNPAILHQPRKASMPFVGRPLARRVLLELVLRDLSIQANL